MSSRFVRIGDSLVNVDDISVVIERRKNSAICMRGDYEGIGMIPINKTLDELLKILNAKEQPVDWIPINERLPKEKQDVLLAFKHNMAVGFWEDILNDGGQTWYANSGNGWMTPTETVDDDGCPLAWMPLPDLYKG